MTSRTIPAVALAVAWLTCGCAALSPQADTTRYFVLTPHTASAPKSAVSFDRSLGIGPLSTPDHLQDYLVTRLADEEIAISDTDRWSEPLQDTLPRVIRENLIAMLGTDRISIYPWDPSAPPDLAVRIEVVHFEVTTRGTADLAARWSIERGSDRAPLLGEQTSLSKPIPGSDTRAAVAVLSGEVGELSQQIAGAIRKVAISYHSESHGPPPSALARVPNVPREREDLRGLVPTRLQGSAQKQMDPLPGLKQTSPAQHCDVIERAPSFEARRAGRAGALPPAADAAPYTLY